ncbi:hypothetical protein OVA24_01800 [Luteolibacter sp. SL250]|uniref:hypothetical protein n=1 Tax=Luteolibacter sp. SL250 TaxID=2995170 RepID=UPI00226E04C6|nr:hypothetical protein [Luteolibacter sp. SL250]WAC20111.1 hypothetical protein OVA24_01800 [Luteolibacter sp. SL250]
MKRPAVLAAALLFLLPVHSRAEEGGFIRVEEDAKAARLQTGVTRYEKDGAVVDLIGAVHIGDKAYYEDLNKRFAGYEVLLFEMIGGEGIKPGDEAAPKVADQEAPDPLAVIYDKIARALKLVGQVDHIDYHAENFLHADLSASEFSEKLEERDESLLKFMLNLDHSGTQPNPVKFILGAVFGRADLLKLSLIHTLGDAEDQISKLAGDNVIIGDRNIRCLEVLARELGAGRKKVGIFYGAAHYPDMQQRLLEQGFTRTGHEWVTAWNVLKPVRKPAAPAGS